MLPLPESLCQPILRSGTSIVEGIATQKPAELSSHLRGRHFGDDFRHADGAVSPLLAEQWSAATAAGWLYASMAIGSLVVTFFMRLVLESAAPRAIVIAAAAAVGRRDHPARLSRPTAER